MSDGFDGCTFCRTQALHVEELEEKIRQLEAQLYNHDYEPPIELGLTPLEASMVSAMVGGGGRTLTHEFLVEATRTPRLKTYAEPKLAQTVTCKIRRKLAPFGLVIETVWGRGYRLSDESRMRLLTWPTPTTRAAA